jgi:hypothetical protein
VILPTKHIAIPESVIGMGASILGHMTRPLTLSRLWERVRELEEHTSYERFLLTLDLLYSIDAINLEDGLLKRKRP